MRIQHNIAALNAYRNLTNNNSSVSKNLEKLSSGYRINRAGDDAAGLAISEKMRAQITGLNTAQKNAQDGISLVQTAEGALTEVHSMLNRMVELANQSANGTYANQPDRENLQAEITSLKAEIDRISQATNFNGINLLDGSREATTTPGDEVVTGLKDITATELTHIADGVKPQAPVKGEFTLDLTELEMRNDGIKAEIQGTVPTTTNVTEGTATSKATIEFNLSGVTVPGVADATNNGKLTLKIGDAEITGTIPAGEDGIDADAKWAGIFSGDVTVNGVEFTAVTANDGKVTLTAKADGVTTLGTVAGSLEVSEASDAKTKATINFGSNELGSVEIKAGESMTGAKWAEEFMKTLTDSKTTIDGIDYTVKNSNGKLTFTMVDDPKTDFTTDLTATVKVTDSTGTTTYAAAGNDAVSVNGNPVKDNDAGVFINQGNGIGVHMDKQPVAGGDRVLAQGSLDLTNIVKDGAALKIGDETYIFAVGADSKFKGMDNVIDLTNHATVDAAALKDASQKLSKVAAGNKMFDVSTDNVNGTIRLTERKDSGIDYTKNNLAGATDANLKDATEAAWKDLIQVGTANADAKPASTTGGLILQIGDTSDTFNKMTVSIKDMSTKALGIDGIDISTQDGAAAAVDKIKDAINAVSSQRGDLGAIQNRLEHTINNLSVTAENITAAESRIRDVDMAEEMMAYTKNNILVQAAQAMLAQANQVPQGVLQLLQ